MRWTNEKYLISRKYFEIYQMVGNISIDGFKRERYVVKVKDISDELVRTYQALDDEEAKIESQYAAQQQENSIARTQQYSLIEENKHSYSTEQEAR
jgi:phage host-nuclease inhibitor protein Gam